MEKADNEKYLIFPYNIANNPDIVINFKETNREEKIAFARFNIPTEFVFFNDSKKANLCLFYICLNKNDCLNKTFKIDQKVEKMSGWCNYYTTEKKTKPNYDDEFLFDIKFERNEKYLLNKDPEGIPLEKLDQIKMFLIFLVSQKEKNLFKMTQYFLNDFEKRFYLLKQNSKQKLVLNTKDDVDSFLEYITRIYVAQIKTSQTDQTITGCFLIFLGLISNEGFKNCQKNKLGSILIDVIVEFFKSKEGATIMQEIFNSNTMIKYFKKGLVYAFSVCCFSNDSVGYLIPFIISLMELKDVNLSEKIVVNESTYLELIGFPLTPGKWQIIRTSMIDLLFLYYIERVAPVLLEIFRFSLANLIEFIEVILENDPNFEINILLSENKQIILDIISYNKTNSREEFEKFQNFNRSTKIFKDFTKEIYIHFIKNGLDSDLTLELLDKEELNSDTTANEVWKSISQILNDKMYFFNLDQLVSLSQKAQLVTKLKGETSKEAQVANDLIRRRIIEKLKLKSFSDDTEKEILKKYLNNRVIFPNGCLTYLEDNVFKKLSKQEDFRLEIRFILEIVLEQFDCCDKNHAEALIKQLFASTLKYKFADNSVLGQRVIETLNKIRMKNEELSLSLFKDFLEYFFQIHGNKIKILKTLLFNLPNKRFFCQLTRKKARNF